MQKAWQAGTFVDFGQKRSGQDGRGVWRNSGGRFLPAEAAGGYKTVAGAYFCGLGACTQYDPKVILGAKTLDPKCDAKNGSLCNSKKILCAKTLDPKGDLYDRVGCLASAGSSCFAGAVSLKKRWFIVFHLGVQ